ncbi:MAG: mechanosensitive ion channel [Acidobacteria bacterium]|nr:mechanosensitive ion channel [Acidobacteriota bacterium]
MDVEPHILWKAWQTLIDPWFWAELGQRLLVLGALLVGARIFLRVSRALVRRLVRARVKDQRLVTLVEVIQSLVWYVVVLGVLLLGLYILGVPTIHLLTGLGLGGLVLALGMQDLIRDLVSGISILLEGTMAVGDQVVLNSNAFLSGRVVGMGARVVKLEGPEGQIHQVAYSSITSISNLSRQRRPAERPPA